MTSFAADDLMPDATTGLRGQTARAPIPLWFCVALALVLGLALSWPLVLGVWRNGTFTDPDDAMRLVQVRDFLAGQGWYDLVAHRLDPPHGVLMHWSRVVDVPLACLIRLFELGAPAQSAERLARIVFPIALQAALYIGVARLARLLMGPRAVPIAVFLALFSGAIFGQFRPGRIDHHAPQIVLLVFMLGGLLAALDPARARQAALAAALAALSLSISIENLPFILTFAGLVVGAWVWAGAPMRPLLLNFAGGLAVALPLCLAATVAPSRWLVGAGDAFSAGHLVAGLAGAAALAALAGLSARLRHPAARAGAAIAAAVLVAAAVDLTYPIVLRDPFAAVDPVVRDVWLANVSEVWSLRRFWQAQQWAAAIFALPTLLGLAGALAALHASRGLAAARWALVVVATIAGAAVAVCLIRVFTFVAPLALLGGVWVVLKVQNALARSRFRRIAAVALVAILPFSSMAWAAVLGSARDATPATAARAACLFSPAAFAPLAKLPRGLVLAPIDAGAHLLAFTPHAVLAAPYHRNNDGNRAALDAFLASPDAAHAIVKGRGVAYVMLCPGLHETATLAARAPAGLAAALSANDVPDWLAPVAIADTPYRVFTVK